MMASLSIHFRFEERTHCLSFLKDVIGKTRKPCYIHSKTLGARTIAQCVQEGYVMLTLGALLIVVFDDTFHVP